MTDNSAALAQSAVPHREERAQAGERALAWGLAAMDAPETSAVRHREDKPPEIHPDAVRLSAFRAMPDGSGRQYTVSEAPGGRRAIEHITRTAWHVGYLEPSHIEEVEKCYAVLDLLDDGDGIVQDMCIPTAKAFRWWYRKLGLRVVPEPAQEASRG